MNVPQEIKDKMVQFYIGKKLTDKKAFFPGRQGFKWVSLNKDKAVNDLGNLTEYGKEKLLEQNIKAEFAYQGYDGNSKPSKEDVVEVLLLVKSDMIERGTW